MTTLDPSHFPWLAHTSDSATGGAVHTSVSPFPGRTARGSSRATDHNDTHSGRKESRDADEHDWIQKQKDAYRDRRRQAREESRALNKIPTLPIPDVRFEQSYLMSIQPFIHSTATTQDHSISHAHRKDAPPTNKDKRRRVEESLALVEDPASRVGSGVDDLFLSSNDRKVDIDWNKIVYITLRDQGALWAAGGIVLSSTLAYWQSSGAGSRQSGLRQSSFWTRLFAPLRNISLTQ